MAMITAAAAGSPEDPNGLMIIKIPDEEQGCWVFHENPLYSPLPQFQYSSCIGTGTTTSTTSQYSWRQLHQPPLRRRLPISARSIAASFRGLTRASSSATKLASFPVMEDATSRSQIVMRLKTELEVERRARESTECQNKKLTEELADEKRRKEEAERICRELEKEILKQKAEVERMRFEMEEERKMLRMAEGFREERIQMKLAEADLIYHQKLAEARAIHPNEVAVLVPPQPPPAATSTMTSTRGGDRENSSPVGIISKRSILKEKNNDQVVKLLSISVQQRKAAASPLEPENPHIKRGIKGFVEFPRVVKAIGSKNKNNRESDAGTIMKMECQKAQLRILLRRQRSSLPLQSTKYP